MTLSIGFDPGGTGRKWSYVCAAIDDDERLFVGRLQDGVRQPILDVGKFPFLSVSTIKSIHQCLDGLIYDLLTGSGAKFKGQQDPLKAALHTFGDILVAVDAPSGFAAPKNYVRNTERFVGNNFRTPDLSTFLNKAKDWLSKNNYTPLRQKVYWKLVGFCIYQYFLRCDLSDGVATNACAGVSLNLKLSPKSFEKYKIRVLESFPSTTYRNTSVEAFNIASQLAKRKLVQVSSAPLSHQTFEKFQNILNQISSGNRVVWNRTRTAVGDALDSFACLLLAETGRKIGLSLIADDLKRIEVEGAIAVPI